MGRARKTFLFPRTVNGLTNIWRYSLQDRTLTQITFGTGPDSWPMRDPGGKGIYFVNGQSSVSLTAYHVPAKQSTEVASDDATNPTISPDGKHVMYCTLLRGKRHELWVADIDGGNKLKPLFRLFFEAYGIAVRHPKFTKPSCVTPSRIGCGL